ncbi:MAG TPA: hypothetical protein VGS05_07160 [Candidatus Sulfotelmatobacter sp.]|nr:hypothetical protein [Candidatus Sulfotelmatobacter sp.]
MDFGLGYGVGWDGAGGFGTGVGLDVGVAEVFGDDLFVGFAVVGVIGAALGRGGGGSGGGFVDGEVVFESG